MKSNSVRSIDPSKFNVTESGQVVKENEMTKTNKGKTRTSTCLVCGKQFLTVGEKYNPLCPECLEARGEVNKLDVHKEDIIGHPNHYCAGRKYEPKDVIRDWDLNFNLGNAVKYISRNGRKDGNSALQDLKKARQYLDFEIAYLEKEE